jgi:hypothetical protein
LKKAGRRIFFIFITGVLGGETQTDYCRSCETPNVFF